MLFRPSRTEDVVRISVEAKDAAELLEAIEEAKALLSRALSTGGGSG
jgi:phosphomannomutase